MKNNLFLLVASCIVFLTGCHDSQYVIKLTDKNVKYKYAYNWFQKGNYYEAIPVIEDAMPYFKGSDTAEKLYFMLAESYFFNKEYTVAAYHFKTFRDIYPRSYKSEIAAYKIAECYRQEVPRLDLEQTDTEKAIEYYKNFISEYPQSTMVELAYAQIDKMKRILELKALSSADLYYQTQNYRAAAVSYKNVVNQFPNIKEYEELQYKIALSYFKFAEKSIVSKQVERYETAMNEGQNFVNRFPNSKLKEEITVIVDKCKVKLLESSLKNANTYYILEERPFYYHQSIALFEEFAPDIKHIPSELASYKNKCYLGIVKAHYYMLEDLKNAEEKKTKYKQFLDTYYSVIDKFSAKSAELYEAEEIFKKVNQYYKS